MFQAYEQYRSDFEADLILGGVLAWGQSHGLLGEFPVCQAYVEKLKQRPAYPA